MFFKYFSYICKIKRIFIVFQRNKIFSVKLKRRAMEGQKKAKRIEVVELPVSELNHGFPNPRKPLTQKNKQALEDSLKRLGDFGVIVIDEENNIISGNQRCKILSQLDPQRKVLCKKLIGYSESEKRAINVKANTHAGEFDMKKLTDWVGDLQVVDLGADFSRLKQRETKIKDMELIRYEKYDYVMIVCRNEVDYNNLTRLLGIDDKKVLVAKTATKDRKIKCRAIWYDQLQADVVPKKK